MSRRPFGNSNLNKFSSRRTWVLALVFLLSFAPFQVRFSPAAFIAFVRLVPSNRNKVCSVFRRSMERTAAEVKDLATLAREAANAEDLEVGGIVWLEHINLVVGLRDVAEVFYFQALGLTRDPQKDVGGTMWANVGPRQQLHLVSPTKTRTEQVIDGCIGLALPDLDALRTRLGKAEKLLSGTKYAVEDMGDYLLVSCPWGNIFAIFSTSARDPSPNKRRRTSMESLHAAVDSGMAVRNGAGIRFIHFRCQNADRVAKFYEQTFRCPAYMRADGQSAAVCVGPSVHLIFSTAPADSAAAKLSTGIHICIYINEFRKVHDHLAARNLVWTNPNFAHLDSCGSYEEAAACRQFRFRSLKLEGEEEELIELEHETRSLRHLQFMKEVYYIGK